MSNRPTIALVTSADVRARFDAARRAGRRAQTSLDLPREPWDLHGERIVCVAEIDGPNTARQAVEALLRGVDLIAALPLAGPTTSAPPDPAAALSDPTVSWVADFLDDLHRLGAVSESAPEEPRDAARSVAGLLVELSGDQRQILAGLATGESLPDLAGRLHLSLRTCERRLSAAKRLLGVATTAEAIIAASRAGV